MDNTPKLFSKSSIIIFSALGSTFFGALLYSSNLKATNNGKLIVHAIIFSMVYSFLVHRMSFLIHVPFYYCFIPVHLIGGLILVGPFWKFQIGVIEHYEKRSLWGPSFALIFPIAVYLFLIIFYQNFNPFRFNNKMNASEFRQTAQTEYNKAFENANLVLQDSTAHFFDLNIPLPKSSYFFTTHIEDVNTFYNYIDYQEGRFMILCTRIVLSDKDVFDLSLFGKECTITPTNKLFLTFSPINCANYMKKVNDTLSLRGTIAMIQIENIGYQYVTQYSNLDKSSADELSYSLINSITKDSSKQTERKLGVH